MGQRSRGARGKGAVLSGVATAALVALGVSHRQFAQANRRYEESRTSYEQATYEAETLRRRATMMDRYDRAHQLNRFRSLSLAAFLSLYGYGLIDTLLFHSSVDVLEPGLAAGTAARIRPTWSPAPDGMALGFRVLF